MKFALANARKTMKDKILISFFFNARGEDLEKSTIGTYRSLLLQLLERLPHLQSVFDTSGFSASSTGAVHRWSTEELKILLEDAILSLGGSSVICFIDALDECAEEQIRDMIAFFERIGELTLSSGIRFLVCFSSRHYPYITIKYGLDLVLEGQEGHTQDITNYLECELKIGQSKIAQQVRSELQEKASGIFMWVVLVIGILNKEHDGGRIHALRRRLQEIPGDLYELFRDILTRDSYNRDELVLCIQWVLFAKQPLSPEQLYFAILSGVEPDAVASWNHDEFTKDVIRRFILDSSKGLAEITTSKLQRVQFIHESVRDFLLKDGLGSVWSDLRDNFQGQSHERLKQCCLNYISADDVACFTTSVYLREALPRDAFNKIITNNFPFLEHALCNLLYHADAAELYGFTQIDFCRNFPLSHWIKLNNLFVKDSLFKHTEKMSLLYLLAERNMANLIREVYRSPLSYLEVGNELYGPPLFAAMATRSKEAVNVMENVLVNLSPGSRSHESDHQCLQDQSRIQSFGRFFKFPHRRTVLSYLAEIKDERMFAFLLDTGRLDVNEKDRDGQTPLLWAAEKGCETIVRLLLEVDTVDTDVNDTNGQTPLSWAAEKGHDKIVELLLKTNKVDVNTQDQSKSTPLSWAARNGAKDVVKMLLDTGKVDVNAKDQYGQTPLWWAARNGYEAVVKMLQPSSKLPR